jgi:hypothetical protein
MRTVPCKPAYFHEGLEAYVVCAAAISQEYAMQFSSTRADRPNKVGPGGGTMLCHDCADDLKPILANIAAVKQEWAE